MTAAQSGRVEGDVTRAVVSARSVVAGCCSVVASSGGEMVSGPISRASLSGSLTPVYVTKYRHVSPSVTTPLERECRANCGSTQASLAAAAALPTDVLSTRALPQPDAKSSNSTVTFSSPISA